MKLDKQFSSLLSGFYKKKQRPVLNISTYIRHLKVSNNLPSWVFCSARLNKAKLDTVMFSFMLEMWIRDPFLQTDEAKIRCHKTSSSFVGFVFFFWSFEHMGSIVPEMERDTIVKQSHILYFVSSTWPVDIKYHWTVVVFNCVSGSWNHLWLKQQLRLQVKDSLFVSYWKVLRPTNCRYLSCSTFQIGGGG